MSADCDPEAFAIPTIDQLDRMRVARGLSQRELSRRAGCEEGRFHHILRNDIDPQTSTMRALLGALQAAEATPPEAVERTGPKPRRSSCADSDDPEAYDSIRGKLGAMEPGDLGEDPRPPEEQGGGSA